MNLIDTHSHLFLEDFDSDRDLIIANAMLMGVNKIILPNIDTETLPKALELSNKYPSVCFPAYGLHPTSVKENYINQLNIIERFITDNHCIAIGETGIDLYWDKTFYKQQCDAFSIQIDIARQLRVPIIIHCRESFNEIIEILNKKAGDGLTGVFHSFTGTKEQAGTIIELGFKLGINGVVTFKNSQLPVELENIPLEELVLETDSPYLTPVPKRGKRNDSSYLIYIAQKIADIKKLSVEQIATITSETAKKLFNFN